MTVGEASPLLDFFRRGEVAREVRLQAAHGAVAPSPHDQLALLAMLVDDPDPEVAAVASHTIDAIPPDSLAAFLARADVSEDLRRFFEARGLEPAAVPAARGHVPLVDAETDLPAVATDDRAQPPQLLSLLPVMDRMKLALKGSREQRATLIRDSNRMVAVSVLSSPKLNEAEIETFARMPTVTEEILRIIANNRTWMKHYSVAAALSRNPKTPVAIALRLLPRLNARDIRLISTDRNVPEPVRVFCRRLVATSEARRR